MIRHSGEADDHEQLQRELLWHWYSPDDERLSFLRDAPAVSLMKAASGAVFLGGLVLYLKVRGVEGGWASLLALLVVCGTLKLAGDFLARRAWTGLGAPLRHRLRAQELLARLVLFVVGVTGGLGVAFLLES